MARGYLVLDIETVPDTELWGLETSPDAPAASAASVERPFPPLHAHRPIVLGALWLDPDYRFRRLGVIGENKDEKAMLEDFSSFVARHQPDLVTYNGRSFDLPVLTLRALRHGVAMSWYYQDPRYYQDGHLDLCDLLSDHGRAVRALSLDSVARLIGLPGKVGVDGSQVEGLFLEGRLAEIQSYCLADVAQTGLLFLRFRLMQGAMGPDEYRGRVADLMDKLRGESRLADLMRQIDGEKLLRAAA
jgi:predicted PolB exonuclease-like 3'-5' exonuclease